MLKFGCFVVCTHIGDAEGRQHRVHVHRGRAAGCLRAVSVRELVSKSSSFDKALTGLGVLPCGKLSENDGPFFVWVATGYAPLAIEIVVLGVFMFFQCIVGLTPAVVSLNNRVG